MSKITIKKFRGINRDGDSPDMPIETFQDMINWDIDKTTQQLVARRPFYPYNEINSDGTNDFIGSQNSLLATHFTLYKCFKYSVGVADVQHNTMCIFKSKSPIDPTDPNRYAWVVIDNGPFGGDGNSFAIISPKEYIVNPKGGSPQPVNINVLNGYFCEPVAVNGIVRLYLGPKDDYYIWMPIKNDKAFRLLGELHTYAIGNNTTAFPFPLYYHDIEDIVNLQYGKIFLYEEMIDNVVGTSEAVVKSFLMLEGRLYHNYNTSGYTHGVKRFEAIANRKSGAGLLSKGKYYFKLAPMFDHSPTQYGAPIADYTAEVFANSIVKTFSEKLDNVLMSTAIGKNFKLVNGIGVGVWTVAKALAVLGEPPYWSHLQWGEFDPSTGDPTGITAKLGRDPNFNRSPHSENRFYIPNRNDPSYDLAVVGDVFYTDLIVKYGVRGYDLNSAERDHTFSNVKFTCVAVASNTRKYFEFEVVTRVIDPDLQYIVDGGTRYVYGGETFIYQGTETLNIIDSTGTPLLSPGILLGDLYMHEGMGYVFNIDPDKGGTSADPDIMNYAVLKKDAGVVSQMTHAPDIEFAAATYNRPVIYDWWGAVSQEDSDYSRWYKMYWDGVITDEGEEYQGEVINLSIELPVIGFNPRIIKYGLFLQKDLEGAFVEQDFTLIEEFDVLSPIWMYRYSSDSVYTSLVVTSDSLKTLGFWSQLYGTDGRGFRPFDHTEADITRKLGMAVHRRDRMIGTRMDDDEGQELMARTPISNGAAQLDVWFRPLLLNRGHGRQNNWIEELNDRIYIFQDHDLIQMTVGESNRASDYHFQSTGGGVGTQIPKTVAKSTNALFFANYDGIFKFSGTRPTDISLGAWNEYWRYSISKEDKDRCFGAYNPKTNEYWLYVPGKYNASTQTIERDPKLWIWDDDPNFSTWRTYTLDMLERDLKDTGDVDYTNGSLFLQSIPQHFIADRDNNWIFVDFNNKLYFWKGEEITPDSNDAYSWPILPIKLTLETQNLGERISDILPDRVQLIREDTIKRRTIVDVIRNNTATDTETLVIPTYYTHLPRRTKRRRSTTVRLKIYIEDYLEDIYFLDGADIIKSRSTWKRPKLREVTLYFIPDRKRP